MKRLVLAVVVLSSVLAVAQERKLTVRFGEVETPGFQRLDFASDFLGHRGVLRTEVQHWQLSGSRPDAYEVRCDEVFSECAVAVLRTRFGAAEPLGMASVTHGEAAARWRGMRVQLKAELKTGGVGGWAGLWMRIDGPDGQALSFDNMQDRPLRGTSAFGWHSVVLDVPPTAERLSFGVLLRGPGAVFIREIRFEAVDDTVPTTDLVASLRTQVSER